MIRTGSWKIGFYNVGHEPMIGDVFGCATLGAVAPNKVIEPDEDGLFIWKENVAGTVVSGTYDEVKREVGELYAKSGVCLIFLAAGQGAEALITRIREVFPGISVAGGVAANNGGKGQLSPRAEDAVILFPEENIYDAFSANILKDTGIRFLLSTGIHPRHISALNGLDALADWRMLQSKYGIDETNLNE